jgi:hypothetical protein
MNGQEMNGQEMNNLVDTGNNGNSQVQNMNERNDANFAKYMSKHSNTPTDALEKSPSFNSVKERPLDEDSKQNDGSVIDEHTNEKNKPDPKKSEEDNLTANMKKRLFKQAEKFNSLMSEQAKKIKELEEKLEQSTKPVEPELTRDDFASVKEWNEYQESKGVETVRNIAKEEAKALQAERDKQYQKSEKEKEFNNIIQEKVKILYPEEKERVEFENDISNWAEENQDFLQTEQGQTYIDLMNSSPVGPKLIHLIAKECDKNPNLIDSLSRLKPQELYRRLKNFEETVISNIRKGITSRNKPAAVKQTISPVAPKIPSTGRVSASGGQKMNAWDILKSRHPSKY